MTATLSEEVIGILVDRAERWAELIEGDDLSEDDPDTAATIRRELDECWDAIGAVNGAVAR